MRTSFLHITLLSEATPGKGGGTCGEVDVEINHDQYGLPVISGRTIQGLLRQSWQDFVGVFPELGKPGRTIFGNAGDNDEACIMRVGDGELPEYVTITVRNALTRKNKPLDRDRILLSLTGTRHQTAQNRNTGAPRSGSLRTSRVLIPGITLIAPITWLREPSDDEQRCFAMTILGARHLGAGTTRGRGHVRIDIDGNPNLAAKLAGLEAKLV